MILFLTVYTIHPSIFYTVNPSVGLRGGWSLSQQSSGKSRGTPWTGCQSIIGPHRDKQPHTLTPKVNLETPINLTCIFLDDGRKLEYPERYTGRTCKLHTERPQLGVEPGTLSLWGNSANHHTTVPNVLLSFSFGESGACTVVHSILQQYWVNAAGDTHRG